MIVGVKVGYSSPINRVIFEGHVFGVLARNTPLPTNTSYIDMPCSLTSQLYLNAEEVRKLYLHGPKRKHLTLEVKSSKVNNTIKTH
jgi:hypothetical protein